jgi:hypothetical protein
MLQMVWAIEEGGKEVLFPSTITLTDPSRASGIGFHNSIKLKTTAAVSKHILNEDLRLTRVRLKVLALLYGPGLPFDFQASRHIRENIDLLILQKHNRKLEIKLLNSID